MLEDRRPFGSANGSTSLPTAEFKSPAALRPALAELIIACDYARAAQRNRWEFALSLDCLQKLQLTETDGRWLVAMGYAEHAHEVTRHEDAARQFRLAINLRFTSRTCLVLTTLGETFARELVGQSNPLAPRIVAAEDNSNEARHSPVPHDAKPVWDCQRHELRYAGKLVKQFKWPAVNQETLLAAFQEEGWPGRIDDPLPPQPEQDSRRRLHDTVKCLNKNQKSTLIHFRGDGTGEGVCWEHISRDEVAAKEYATGS